VANRHTPIDATPLPRRWRPPVCGACHRRPSGEIKKLIDTVEGETGQPVHPHGDGHPGPAPRTRSASDAQKIAALKRAWRAVYPDIQGIPPLKLEISRFVKNFLDVTVDPEHCPANGRLDDGARWPAS